MRYELLENGVRVGMVSTSLDVQRIYSVDICNVNTVEYSYVTREGVIGLTVRAPRRANYDAKRTAVHIVRDIAARYQHAKANYALDLDLTTANYAEAILAEFSVVPGMGLIRTAVSDRFYIARDEETLIINYNDESATDPNLFTQSIFSSLRDMRAIRPWSTQWS